MMMIFSRNFFFRATPYSVGPSDDRYWKSELELALRVLSVSPPELVMSPLKIEIE
jgi:hypothetical protein